jgi:hypothetical protein
MTMREDNPSYDEIVREGRAFDKKVRDMFTDLAGDRVNLLAGDNFPQEVCNRLYGVLKSTGADDKVARYSIPSHRHRVRCGILDGGLLIS